MILYLKFEIKKFEIGEIVMLGIFTENNNFKRIFSKLKPKKPDFSFHSVSYFISYNLYKKRKFEIQISDFLTIIDNRENKDILF